MAYQLPALPYAYDALEPHFDTQTMEIHHSKHHQAYVNNANAVLANLSEWEKLSAEELIARLAELPENVRTPLRNNAGGHAFKTAGGFVPVDHLPEGFDVVGAAVLEFQVVGVLPHVQANNRIARCAGYSLTHQWRILVGSGNNFELAIFIHQPGPA